MRAGHEVGRETGHEHAEVHAGLQHGGDPGTPALWPGLRKQRRADGPFAADAERGEETKDEQLPPRLREAGETGERGVGENGETKRTAASEFVPEASEEPPAQGPAN